MQTAFFVELESGIWVNVSQISEVNISKDKQAVAFVVNGEPHLYHKPAMVARLEQALRACAIVTVPQP